MLSSSVGGVILDVEVGKLGKVRRREVVDVEGHDYAPDPFNPTFTLLACCPTPCTLQSNTRFYAAKEAVLQSLPEGTTPEQREVALSEFYHNWVAQERTRLDEYGEEWRRRNWAAILLGARVHYEKFVSRIMHPFS